MSGTEDAREFLDERLKRVINWAIVTFRQALDYECEIIELPLETARESGMPQQAIYNAIESLKSALSNLGPEAGLSTYQVTGETDIGNGVTVFLDFVSDQGGKVQAQLNVKVDGEA